jgi:ubiquitin-protein ligase
MRESPRVRRLRNDLRTLEAVRAQSTILDFQAIGDPPDRYIVRFFGRGLGRVAGRDGLAERNEHEVSVTLGAGYPRSMPELMWRSPVFHPNISSSGWVCLGGYGTHWAPSVGLDELMEMLWDMIRYRNFDIESPYNREAAIWARDQSRDSFPLDPRPLRNHVAAWAAHHRPHDACSPPHVVASPPQRVVEPSSAPLEVVVAQAVRQSRPEIVFLD